MGTSLIDCTTLGRWTLKTSCQNHGARSMKVCAPAVPVARSMFSTSSAKRARARRSSRRSSSSSIARWNSAASRLSAAKSALHLRPSSDSSLISSSHSLRSASRCFSATSLRTNPGSSRLVWRCARSLSNQARMSGSCWMSTPHTRRAPKKPSSDLPFASRSMNSRNPRIAVIRCFSAVGSSMNASSEVAWFTSPAASRQRLIHLLKRLKMVEMDSW